MPRRERPWQPASLLGHLAGATCAVSYTRRKGLPPDGPRPASPTSFCDWAAQTAGMPRVRTFFVEDSPIVLETLAAALEEMADVEVVGSARSETEALAWFGCRSDACDVAIIDVFLQSGSGLGVLEGMKAFASPPQRVVLTNYSTADMRARCMALGAEEVFDKSTELEELVSWFHDRQTASPP